MGQTYSTSRINIKSHVIIKSQSKLSAHTYLFGNFDFNATPLAPPGTKVVVHKKTGNRRSWQYHGAAGWSAGYSPDHYRCLCCFMPDTVTEIDADTAHLIPHNTLIPAFSDKDALEQAVMDVLHLLKNPSNTNIPTIFLKAPQFRVHVATLLNYWAEKPINPHP
eukprot:7766170-Ditylum_brightwellii.AAC.1